MKLLCRQKGNCMKRVDDVVAHSLTIPYRLDAGQYFIPLLQYIFSTSCLGNLFLTTSEPSSVVKRNRYSAKKNTDISKAPMCLVSTCIISAGPCL